MKITILDGYPLNSGDMSWNAIAALGELTVHDRTSIDLVVERCKNADIVLTNKVPLSKNDIEQLNQLKLISVLATGYNIVDIAAARSKGITVCNVPAYGTDSVAQHTFALLLMLSNATHVNTTSVESGEWQKSIDWSYTKKPIVELAGKTIGIVGFGNIGKKTASLAHAFGMRVLYNSKREQQNNGAEFRQIEALFQESDFISLHCPLDDTNKQFVNKSLLTKMKPTAFLINTARGQLIHEQDLADALNQHIIAGAALDVLSTEPPAATNPLLHAANCIITPHTAWMSKEARQRIIDITAKNIECYLLNAPRNVVG